MTLFTGSGLKSVPVDSIATFTIDDPRLREEFGRALAVLATAREADKKSVGLDFSGKGSRRVRLGYVVESPVWKTSYRLLLGDAKDDSKANLQGWAIVENQTDNDWTDVSLSLVSGRPISFQMDLYDPLYVERPTVVPELYSSLRPQQYAEGMKEKNRRASVTNQEMSKAVGGGGGGFGGGGEGYTADAPAAAMAPSPAREPMDAAASVQSVANAQNLGELFEYKVGDVSIARQSSAMLPIVTDPVEAAPVSIYNATVLEKHPLNGAILKNMTGKHLLQGPITVFADGGYAGDAQIGDTPPGETRLLSYGIDLKVDAQHEQKPGRSSLLTAKLSNGVLTLTRKYRSVHAYSFQNDADKPRTVVLEHPFDRNYDLVETPDAYETTDALRRFKFDVAADSRKDFVVTGELTSDEGVRLTDRLSAEQFLAYSRGAAIPQKVKDALAKAAELQGQVAETQRKLAEVEADLKAIADEQGRLRENMKTVDNSSDYYKRLLKKLDDGETRIESLQSQQGDLRETLDARQKALRDYLSGLTVG